ncbi:hypothetical protein VKT23_002470 [Stygiomarasmius scandens]|uniref:C2H2-type domain-containing protein n=1 Tax=Marasmiellus scandens TaxID=2682957 RepID=A0ABR1K4Q4_9AGAR
MSYQPETCHYANCDCVDSHVDRKSKTIYRVSDSSASSVPLPNFHKYLQDHSSPTQHSRHHNQLEAATVDASFSHTPIPALHDAQSQWNGSPSNVTAHQLPFDYTYAGPYIFGTNPNLNGFPFSLPAEGEIVQELVNHGETVLSAENGVYYGPPPFPDLSQHPNGGTAPYPAQFGNGGIDTTDYSTLLNAGITLGDVAKTQAVASKALVDASRRRRKNPKEKGRHACEMCGQDFTAGHNLKNHMNSHMGRRPFPCEHCDGRFGTAHVLKRHVSTKHKLLIHTNMARRTRAKM